MARFAWGAALVGSLLTTGTACEDTSCGAYTLEGLDAGEQCGINGSFGFVYIDEGMVTALLTPYTELDGDLDAFEQAVATWQIHVRDVHLTPGDPLPPKALIGTCSRFYPGDPTFYTYPAHTTELQVHGESNRRSTGGHSWRVTWRVDCDDQRTGMPLNSSGSDLIEFNWTTSGYDFDLYGIPADWPTEGE
jgi:hypothetical protein